MSHRWSECLALHALELLGMPINHLDLANWECGTTETLFFGQGSYRALSSFGNLRIAFEFKRNLSHCCGQNTLNSPETAD